MRTIIAGSRECTDYDLMCEVIEKAKESGITITTIISGECRGVDKMGEKYAEEKGLNLISFPAKWSDIEVEGAVIKEKMNPWKKKMEKYNSVAGFQRNQLMADNADALIAIDLGTNGTGDMIKRAEKAGLKVYIHRPNLDEDLEIIKF